MLTTQLLYALAGCVIVALGLRGALLHASLLQRIVAINIMGAGVFMLLVAVAYRGLERSPDPVPHALVLTGITLVLGGSDTGKSTLCNYLVYRAYVTGEPVALVDLVQEFAERNLGVPLAQMDEGRRNAFAKARKEAEALKAEINAEMEHQTAHDSTVGHPRPMGERGAANEDGNVDARVPAVLVGARGGDGVVAHVSAGGAAVDSIAHP